MAKQKTTEKILFSLTNVKQKKREERQAFLVRLSKVSYKKVSDDQYDELPKKVQIWLDNSVTAIDKGEPVSDFSEVTESDIINEDKPKEIIMETAKTAVKKGTVAKPAAKRVAKRVAKKATHLKVAAKSASKAKGKVFKKGTLPTTATSAIRQLVLQNQGLSKAQIGEKLTAAGIKFNVGTLNVTFAATAELLAMQRQLKITA